MHRKIRKQFLKYTINEHLPIVKFGYKWTNWLITFQLLTFLFYFLIKISHFFVINKMCKNLIINRVEQNLKLEKK